MVQRSLVRPMLGLLGALLLPACASGDPELPPPRTIVVHTGERLNADPERMQVVHEWVTRAVETIDQDPSFMLDWGYVPEPRYPWETMELVPGDTVRIAFEQAAPDVQTSYWIYAFLHQMNAMGRLVDWFPESEGLEGYELERFIVERTAESWLLGRATFDTHPYQKLDELIYAEAAGMLDAFILYTRPEEFPEARERFLEANPDGFEPFEAWYREAFGEDPPGGG